MRVAVCLHGLARGSAVEAGGAYAEKFAYLRSKLEGYDVDYFIHSWDVDIQEELTLIFDPKLTVFEPQVNFHDEMVSLIDPGRYANNNNGDLFKTLSFAYSRMRSVELKRDYEKQNDFRYDCVLISRFDVGHHNNGLNKTSKLKFTPEKDMDKIYQAFWDQTNAGASDHWFYGSSELMDKVGSFYNHIIDYLQPWSDYVRTSYIGWPLSSADSEFTNEIFKSKREQSTRLQRRTSWWQLNNHCLYKWHFMNMGYWSSDKCCFLNEELWN